MWKSIQPSRHGTPTRCLRSGFGTYHRQADRGGSAGKLPGHVIMRSGLKPKLTTSFKPEVPATVEPGKKTDLFFESSRLSKATTPVRTTCPARRRNQAMASPPPPSPPTPPPGSRGPCRPHKISPSSSTSDRPPGIEYRRWCAGPSRAWDFSRMRSEGAVVIEPPGSQLILARLS